MWLPQKKGVKKKIYGYDLGEEFYTKCLSFLLLLNLKYLQILNCVSFVIIFNLCSRVTYWNERKKFISVNIIQCFIS